MDILSLVAAIVASVFASSGFWLYVNNRREKRDNQALLLLGLAHDRIVYLGEKYIVRGWISRDEYENLFEYLYKPYRMMGGNGCAEKIMSEVQDLPFTNKECKDVK